MSLGSWQLRPMCAALNRFKQKCHFAIPFLIAVAAIDPVVRNKGDTLLHLQSIPVHVKNFIRYEDIEE